MLPSPDLALVYSRVPGRTGERLARRVHEGLAELTGKRVAFPQTYDAAALEGLMRSW